MITFFTAPKPFRGSIDIIQRNAISSWKELDPNLQVILFGDEYGIEETAKDLHVEHVPHIRCTEYGTPRVDELFSQALQRSELSLLCFINCDIILQRDFIRAARILSARDGLALMLGECEELEIDELVDFKCSEWDTRLAACPAGTHGSRGPFAMDYLLFTRGLFDQLPPFAVGRARYDNWLVWQALQSGAEVIDATGCVEAIHQAHHYAHIPGGFRGTRWGIEARHNKRLSGFWLSYVRIYGLFDATHRLTTRGIEKMPSRNGFTRQLWVRLKLFLSERLNGTFKQKYL